MHTKVPLQTSNQKKKKKILEASSRVQDLGAVYSFPLPMTGIRYIAAKRERSSQFQALKYTPISIHV